MKWIKLTHPDDGRPMLIREVESRVSDYDCDDGNGWSLCWEYLSQAFRSQSLRRYCFIQSLKYVPGAYSRELAWVRRQ